MFPLMFAYAGLFIGIISALLFFFVVVIMLLLRVVLNIRRMYNLNYRPSCPAAQFSEGVISSCKFIDSTKCVHRVSTGPGNIGCLV